jgi:ribonucleoside-diphosphate reductase alpha chain
MTERSAIANSIWDMKYRLKQPDGAPVDATINDTFHRVATALAAVEAQPEHWAKAFYSILSTFEFLPAGRILAGAGADRKVTLFNCFVMGAVPDDMGGIFDHLREAALTLQQGGGIGYDFSTLRPRGAAVTGVGADASGPLSFMDVWDAMCRTIMSAGSRRGAMMATLRCDHPDIEAFIEAKREPGRLRNFNLSVLVTDAFMQAVADDADWDLTFNGVVYRRIRARALWDRIMTATYAYAEPGVIFIDRVNAQNNLAYCETIHATNPCGEQPLPQYGACLLGSVNLARLVEAPFSEGADVDLDRLQEVVRIAVRLMDNVVDASRFPLPAQEQEARDKRRIGLGVTGLGDALILCGLRYGAPDAVTRAETWMRVIRDAAYDASIDLATEKGSFPRFDAKAMLARPFIQALPEALRTGIARYGLRNALLTSIAPTGTISLFADNVSSGIEPVFAFSYSRTVLQPDGSRVAETVSDYAYRLFREQFGEDAPLPEAFVDAQSLTPADHLAMQAAAQRYVDSAISKTINCPADISFEAFRDIYAQAYAMGCKGCTTYRPNDITGAVLAVTPASTPDKAEAASARLPTITEQRPMARPDSLPGQTYKIRWADSDHALYITLNDVIVEGRRCPFEIFINSKNMEHYAWTVALTRMISAVFRRGGDVSFVAEELKAVFDPRGGQWLEGRYVPSLLAAIGDVILRHLEAIGFIAPAAISSPPPYGASSGNPQSVGRSCPRCGQNTLIAQEGCVTCMSCGYSKCA